MATSPGSPIPSLAARQANNTLWIAVTAIEHADYGRAVKILDLVLLEKLPAHPIAWLHRSLVYIALGYPELAACDAYRASQLAELVLEHMCDDASLTAEVELVFAAVRDYLSLEACRGQEWKSVPRRYVGGGWLSAPLASVAINCFTERVHRQGERTWKLIHRHAIYRLCGCLATIGWGCLSTAREYIDKMGDDRSAAEQTAIVRMRRAILELSLEAHRTDPEKSRLAGKHRTSLVSRVQYPWDSYGPDLSDYEELRALNSYTGLVAPGLRAAATTQDDSRDSAADDLDIKLVAARNIREGELVLAEDSIIKVMTAYSAPERPADPMFCDTCATQLIIPPEKHELLSFHSARQRLRREYLRGESTKGADVADFVERIFDKHEPLHKPRRDDTPRSSPTVDSGADSTAFEYCVDCIAACWCDMDCGDKMFVHHQRGCDLDLDLDDEIRKAYVGYANDPDVTSGRMERALGEAFVHPKARCIYHLLMMRAFTLAESQRKHVLQLPAFKYLNGGLSRAPSWDEVKRARDGIPWLIPADKPPGGEGLNPPRPSRSARRQPWSLAMNVIFPLRFVENLRPGAGYGWRAPRDYDGWVINTLMAKLMHSTRISIGPEYTKTFDRFGGLVSGPTRIADRRRGSVVSGDAAAEAEGEEAAPWIGTLHTVYSMITAQDIGKGRLVRTEEGGDGRLRCFAESTEDAGGDDDDGSGENGEDGGDDGGGLQMRGGHLDEGEGPLAYRAGQTAVRLADGRDRYRATPSASGAGQSTTRASSGSSWVKGMATLWIEGGQDPAGTAATEEMIIDEYAGW